MTRRELINMIREELKALDDRITDRRKRSAELGMIFDECKVIAARNGYEGITFDNIWDAACRQYELDRKIYLANGGGTWMA